jgi:rhodanese-related sulfurtransferase
MTSHNVLSIDVKTLKTLLDGSSDLCVIDVREIHEWNEAHIPGILHIPKDTIVNSIEAHAPDKSKPVYLHCRSGMRSLYAAQLLIELGYEEVYNVDGGMMDWEHSGYPVEKA